MRPLRFFTARTSARKAGSDVRVLAALSWLAASVGFAALLLQAVVVRRFVRRRSAAPNGFPGISILKPLCGLDDGLEESLEAFARLPYPRYELLLGVRDERDAAYPAARACADRHPGRVRVLLQRGEPGLNPKVNQLVTLGDAAKHELLVVSDSNVRVPPGYLEEIAALFEDADVGCVTHPVGGSGHRRLGSLLDNLHLASSIGAGQIAAKCVSGKDLVVGKSMAMRKADLDALGGWWAFRDYLAEDYVFGRRITGELGRKVAVARTAVVNHSRGKRLGDFVARYKRWSVIHRTAVQPSTYLAQGLLNPLPLAALGAVAYPSAKVAWVFAALVLAKMWIDVATARALCPGAFRVLDGWAVLPKDAILFGTWVRGLVCRTVLWRGNVLKVAAGSRLVAPEAAEEPAPLGLGAHG